MMLPSAAAVNRLRALLPLPSATQAPDLLFCKANGRLSTGPFCTGPAIFRGPVCSGSSPVRGTLPADRPRGPCAMLPSGMPHRSSLQKKKKRWPSRRIRASTKTPARKSMPEYLQQLGIRLRDARIRRSLTQVQLAKKCDLSSRYVAKMEAGGGNISIVRLRELARALEVPI